MFQKIDSNLNSSNLNNSEERMEEEHEEFDDSFNYINSEYRNDAHIAK